MGLFRQTIAVVLCPQHCEVEQNALVRQFGDRHALKCSRGDVRQLKANGHHRPVVLPDASRKIKQRSKPLIPDSFIWTMASTPLVL